MTKKYAFIKTTCQELCPLLILEILLTCVCLLGDQLLFDLEDGLLKALDDNITHILIGVLSWFLIIYNLKTPLTENIQTSLAQCAAAAAISSLMDIDHFIMAMSIHLEDAVGQKTRPLLHNSLLPFGIILLGFLVGRFLRDLKGLQWFSKVSHFNKLLFDTT